MSNSRFNKCSGSLYLGDSPENIIQVIYEEQLLDKVTKKSLRNNGPPKSESTTLEPFGDGPVATHTNIIEHEMYGVTPLPPPPVYPQIRTINTDTNDALYPRIETLSISLDVGPGNIGSLKVKINYDNLVNINSNILNDGGEKKKIWGAVWTDPGPTIAQRVSGQCDKDDNGDCLDFVGDSDNAEYNEFTGDYSPPLKADQLNWVNLENMEESVENNSGNLRKTKLVTVCSGSNTPCEKVFSWVVAGEYDNSNGSVFSETLAMIDSGLVWDQRASSVDISKDVMCFPPIMGGGECIRVDGGTVECGEKEMEYCIDECEWVPGNEEQFCKSWRNETSEFDNEKGCVTVETMDGTEFTTVNLDPCLANLDYSSMNTTLKSGNIKTFVIFLAYGIDITDAKKNFDFGCQTTIHIIVNSDNCLRGWTGIGDPTDLVNQLMNEDITISRTEPLELMQGCQVLGCLDPITGKYQTKSTRPDFQNNPREYCEWLSMSAAQPANIGDIDDIDSNVGSIINGLLENNGRQSINANALKTNWNVNTSMYRTTFSDGDPCIPRMLPGTCSPSLNTENGNDCIDIIDSYECGNDTDCIWDDTPKYGVGPDCYKDEGVRRRGYSIISKITDANNKSPNGIDGPLGDLYGRKWLEITDNNCVYDSYVDDCVERRCGVGNQGENCTVPCCKGTCVYPERGGVANTASTNAVDGWPLIQTARVRDDYMPIPYEVGVDQSSWCKNEIGCEFYEGKEDGVNIDDNESILIYNTGNGGSLEDGSNICTQCAGPPNWLEYDNRNSDSNPIVQAGLGDISLDTDIPRDIIQESGSIPTDIDFAPGSDYTGPQCNMRCCGAVCDPLGGNAMDQCSTQPVDASLTRNYCQYFDEWNKCLEICQGATSEECTDNRGCRWGVDPGNGTGSQNLTACLPNLCACENGVSAVGRNCAMHNTVGCVEGQCDWGYYSELQPFVESECSPAERALNNGECEKYDYFVCLETWWHKFGVWYIQSMDIEEIGKRFFGNDEGGPVRSIVFLCIISSALVSLSAFLQIMGSLSNSGDLAKNGLSIIISFGMSVAIYFVPVLFYTVYYCGPLAGNCDSDIPYGNAWTLLYKLLLPFLVIFIFIIVFKSFISIVNG